MNLLLPPIVGLVIVLLSVVIFAVSIGVSRRPRWMRQWLLAGLALRVVGSMLFLYVIGALYGGGDYEGYFRDGTLYANELFGGPTAFYATGSTWWGTTFMARLTGVIFAAIGPTLPGGFLIFAVLGFLGSVAIWTALCRAFPALDAHASLAWIMCFPSLWFWTSALGKEPVVLLGVGLALLGFVGKHGRRGWLTLTLGVAIVFVIRPQVAAVIVFALVAGQVLGKTREGSAVGLVRSAVLVAAGLATVFLASGALGFELFSVDATTDYIDSRATGSSAGGSAIDAEGAPLWLAPVTTLARPFLWEANGATGFISAVEIAFLWVMLWWRRRRAVELWRVYRRSPVMWASIIFVAVYAVALGLSVGNLGTLVRQRIHILPFLLVLLAGLQRPAKIRRRAAHIPVALALDASA